MAIEFEQLTEEQVNFIWNGVGSKHFFIDPHDLIFKEPSKLHDFLYWRGGNEEDKIKADLIFYKNCKKKCYEHRGLARIFYLSAAWVYYQTLKLLGKYAFEYGEKAQTWEEIETRVRGYPAKSRLKRLVIRRVIDSPAIH